MLLSNNHITTYRCTKLNMIIVPKWTSILHKIGDLYNKTYGYQTLMTLL